MWKNSVFTKITRIIVTSIFPLLFIFMFEGFTPDVCICKKKQIDGNLGFSEQLDCERRFGNSSSWGKKCRKEDGLYYHNEILQLPEEWYKNDN